MSEELLFGFDLDELMLYSTPETLRAAADALEAEGLDENGVQIRVFESMSGSGFARGSLHLLNPDEWTGEDEGR